MSSFRRRCTLLSSPPTSSRFHAAESQDASRAGASSFATVDVGLAPIVDVLMAASRSSYRALVFARGSSNLISSLRRYSRIASARGTSRRSSISAVDSEYIGMAGRDFGMLLYGFIFLNRFLDVRNQR